ncbi:hypothetical protein NL676_010389 [Syzygium grande]|nr:hypothetical protein NL676_010389 [Syzygium grande]
MESTQLQENPSPLSRSQWRHIPIRIYSNQLHSISLSPSKLADCDPRLLSDSSLLEASRRRSCLGSSLHVIVT